MTAGLREAPRCGRRHHGADDDRGWPDLGDDGLTMVELMVAFVALLVLFGIMGTVLTTYLNVGATVTSTYAGTDQLLPSSVIIQRLFRSEVEPAPTLPTTVGGACAVANVPCPPFPTATIGSYSTTFYANLALPPTPGGTVMGPAKVVMALSTPTKCSGCKFPTAQFTITEYPATANCPFSLTATTVCTWSASGTRVVTINNVVNGLTLSGSPLTPVLSATPIFTYNTLDPYSATYVANAGGTASTTPVGNPSGVLPGFATCNAPTTNPNGDPTSSNCPADNVQSVQVDIQVHVQGGSMQENSFTVYRLSSTSYLYSALVG